MEGAGGKGIKGKEGGKLEKTGYFTPGEINVWG